MFRKEVRRLFKRDEVAQPLRAKHNRFVVHGLARRFRRWRQRSRHANGRRRVQLRSLHVHLVHFTRLGITRRSFIRRIFVANYAGDGGDTGRRHTDGAAPPGPSAANARSCLKNLDQITGPARTMGVSPRQSPTLPERPCKHSPQHQPLTPASSHTRAPTKNPHQLGPPGPPPRANRTRRTRGPTGTHTPPPRTHPVVLL